MLRRLVLICTLGAFAGLFVIPLNPIHNSISKVAYIACIFGTWLGITVLVWKQLALRVTVLSISGIIMIVFFLPREEIDPVEIRNIYVQKLIEFNETKYYWGGENSRGIDCSGLPRRAFRDALLIYGITHLNSSALKAYIEQWWFDATAQALSQGYRNYTEPLGIQGAIRDIIYDELLPGDLAVTTNGIHLLVYVDNTQWIQADPGIGKVVILKGRTDDNGWLHTPITMHRWSILN